LDNIERLKLAMDRALRTPENVAPSLLRGKITNIKDPQLKGRAKVLLEYFSVDGQGYETDWLSPIGFELDGQLPKALINSVVYCHSIHGRYEDLLISIPSQKLVYSPEEKPPLATQTNIGLQIILNRSPKDYLLAIGVVRNGQFIWEEVCPLRHLHASGDLISQGNDSGGDFQQPVRPGPTSDVVHVTSATPYFQDSKNLPPSI
jgi:hypothetical protein